MRQHHEALAFVKVMYETADIIQREGLHCGRPTRYEHLVGRPSCLMVTVSRAIDILQKRGDILYSEACTMYDEVTTRLSEVLGGRSPVEWNDTPARETKEVLALVHAIAKSEQSNGLQSGATQNQ